MSYVDSNHDRQNQKLQCYHYTIRQSIAAKAEALNRATKLLTKSRPTKFFRDFNGRRSQLADAKLLKKFVEYGDRSSEV